MTDADDIMDDVNKLSKHINNLLFGNNTSVSPEKMTIILGALAKSMGMAIGDIIMAGDNDLDGMLDTMTQGVMFAAQGHIESHRGTSDAKAEKPPHWKIN